MWENPYFQASTDKKTKESKKTRSPNRFRNCSILPRAFQNLTDVPTSKYSFSFILGQ